jgi:NAD(P)-dependent dehydrogenase (short-subunit alcohol dehydrogenase family)
MSDTIVWVSGATEGVGLGLARTVPYSGARVINLSRRQHPDFETIRFDLTRPDTYQAVRESFEKELAGFKGKRAIFFHNAFYPGRIGFVSEVDAAEYTKCIQANAVAPLILGDMFLRTVKAGYESGLILMSSAAARHPFLGNANYCAAKAGVEMWVRVVKRELKSRGRNTWVVAVRPGFVDTPNTRFAAVQDPADYPVSTQIKLQLESREGVMTPEEAGRGIWASLPPKNDESLLLFGEMVPDKS